MYACPPIIGLLILTALAVLAPAPLMGQGTEPVRSYLETVDITSGEVQTVFAFDRHVEAPNWTPDGRFFILNTGGLLYRLSADAPIKLERIETGFATRLNNDHGVSPDGTLLVISHQEAEQGAEAWLTSTIYVLPVEGSAEPRRVTTLAPSFWHGWSPDGSTLAYTARREGEWDVYSIPLEGGAERRLTTCPGLDDGPDYSPDGQWIYFNSYCSGSMQIWRVRTDGSDPEQLTDDSYSNWFPHPSPDGRWVTFLSYLEDQGDAHPFGQDVRLRLLDVQDGSVRDLTPTFFGGQGTINVPSWSPDSRRVAFIRYERSP